MQYFNVVSKLDFYWQPSHSYYEVVKTKKFSWHILCRAHLHYRVLYELWAWLPTVIIQYLNCCQFCVQKPSSCTFNSNQNNYKNREKSISIFNFMIIIACNLTCNLIETFLLLQWSKWTFLKYLNKLIINAFQMRKKSDCFCNQLYDSCRPYLKVKPSLPGLFSRNWSHVLYWLEIHCKLQLKTTFFIT